MATIKPCPFCGGTEVTIHDGSTFRWITTKCEECGATGPEIRKSLGDGTPLSKQREAAIQEWNKRSLKLETELAKPQPAPVVWMQSNHLNKFEQHACGADSMLARCSHRQLQPDYVPLYSKEEL
jgi:Lar family restriction alleviation protein